MPLPNEVVEHRYGIQTSRQKVNDCFRYHVVCALRVKSTGLVLVGFVEMASAGCYLL